MTETPSSKDI